MVQGTASSVGKSLLCAGLCRIFRQERYRVAPFKAQNMSLNSFATPEGLEIGRAQAVQAAAAGIPPHVDMNPILLKPEADSKSQVVVLGKPVGTSSARDYFQRKVDLWPVVAESLDRLRAQYDVVVIEGAGSPAEVNLRSREIVNMRVAKHAQAPVLLVGDIDRGGVMASLVGTLDLLLPDERELVHGLIVNRFRGDVSLFRDGVTFLEERTGLPVLGVVPYVRDLRIADEDSVALDDKRWVLRGGSEGGLDVAVIRLPHISNFDDFAPLEAEPAARVRYVERADALGWPDVVILPGTKTTMADLVWLRETRLAERVVGLAASGAAVVGICGGYQMLGWSVCDPLGVESSIAEMEGLGLLPVETEFAPEKTTVQVRGRVAAEGGVIGAAAGSDVTAYEIHMGQSRELVDGARPAFTLEGGRTDGLAAGNVLGTYLHGLFDNRQVRRAILGWAAARKGLPVDALDSRPSAEREADAEFDRWAAVLRESLDVAQLKRIVGVS